MALSGGETERDGQRLRIVVNCSSSLLWRFAILAAFLALLWYAGDILLVIFAAILCAVVLRAMSDWIAAKTPLGQRAAYLVTLLLLTAAAGLTIWILGPRVVNQAGQIVQNIPRSVAAAQSHLNQYDWGRYINTVVTHAAQASNMSARISFVLTSGATAVALLVVIVALGFFLGLSPHTYQDGVIRFIPRQHQERAREAMCETGYVLRWWLLGQFVPMGVLGVGSFIGLLILGIPLAFTLSLFTALMLFMPFVGSLLSLIPASLIALLQGPGKMLEVILLYLAVHGLEAYLITPLAQKRAVRLPPVVTILAQFVLWTVSGLLGLIVATPLAAALLALVRMLYFGEKPRYLSAK